MFANVDFTLFGGSQKTNGAVSGVANRIVRG